MKAFYILTFLACGALFLFADGAEEVSENVKISPGIVSQSEIFGVYKHSPQRGVIKRAFHQRSVRSPSTCRYPSDLQDSELDCVSYPSKVICRQTCVFGYTLDQGISVTMKCNYDENKWTPVPVFQHCKPFIDCGITVGPGASYKCHKNFMDRGAYCDISCSHYEDKSAVSKAKYECDIRGKWTPELPFCVKAGSGLILSPEPRGPKTIKDL